jgi:hypothetical protein
MKTHHRILRAGTAGLAALALGAGLLGCSGSPSKAEEFGQSLDRLDCAQREVDGAGRDEVARLRSFGWHADAEALERAIVADGC